MKKLLFSLVMLAGSVSFATAQNAKSDISITGKYRVNTLIQVGKVRIWPVISNNSKSDYKDIAYRIDFAAADGTAEGGSNQVFHDFIGPNVTKKIKELYIDCPKDCKSVTLSITGGKKLD